MINETITQTPWTLGDQIWANETESGDKIAAHALARDREQAQANANLIAAAPNMLAALKAFVEPWNRGGDWGSKINYDTYNNARTAIEKAEGRVT